jgi:transposase
MDQLIARCAGLDVHKETVVVCVRVPGPGQDRLQHVRTVGTMTADLLALRDWLTAQEVMQVAMESTGVYWKPVSPCGKTRKGNRWLRTALIEAVLGAIRTKGCRLAARYRRIMRHRGHTKAVVAVAHTILVSIYHMLTHHEPYQEVGAAYPDQRDREQATRRYVKQLECLGHRVVLEPAA